MRKGDVVNDKVHPDETQLVHLRGKERILSLTYCEWHRHYDPKQDTLDGWLAAGGHTRLTVIQQPAAITRGKWRWRWISFILTCHSFGKPHNPWQHIHILLSLVNSMFVLPGTFPPILQGSGLYQKVVPSAVTPLPPLPLLPPLSNWLSLGLLPLLDRDATPPHHPSASNTSSSCSTLFPLSPSSPLCAKAPVSHSILWKGCKCGGMSCMDSFKQTSTLCRVKATELNLGGEAWWRSTRHGMSQAKWVASCYCSCLSRGRWDHEVCHLLIGRAGLRARAVFHLCVGGFIKRTTSLLSGCNSSKT